MTRTVGVIGVIRGLIRSRKNHTAFRAAAALEALSFLGLRLHWDAANRGLGLVFDGFFTLGRAAPMAPEETARTIQDLNKLLVIINAVAVLFSELDRAIEECLLDGVEHIAHGTVQAIL